MKCKNCESNFNEEYEFYPKCGALNKLKPEIDEQNKSSREILFEKVTSINLFNTENKFIEYINHNNRQTKK